MRLPVFRQWLTITLLAVVAPVYGNDLMTVYQQALEYDAQLAQAIAERKAVYYDKIAARGPLLPQVQLQYSRSEVDTTLASNPLTNPGQRVDSDYTLTALELSASTALWDLSNWYLYQAAVSGEDQASYQLTLAEQDLMLRVSQSYFDYLLARVQLATAEAEVDAVERALELAKQRFELGVSTITDVEEAKARFDSIRVVQLNQQVALKISEEAITMLTGQPVGQLADLNQIMTQIKLAPSRVDEWVMLGLERSATLGVARSRLDQAEMSRNATISTLSPNVQLFASHRDSSQPPFSAGAAPSDVITEQVGIRVSLPLAAGGRLYGSSRAAMKRVVVSEYNVKQQERQVSQNIRSQFYRVTTDVETIKARRQAIISAETAVDAVTAGYQSGSRNIVEVLDAQARVFQAQRDYTGARYDYLVNLVKLKALAGVLIADDLQQINTWLQTDQ